MTANMWWSQLFSALSFLTAAVSAHLWFKASKVKLPPSSDDSWEGKGPFSDALAGQSQINARAAFAAAVTALLQALSMGATFFEPWIKLP